MNQTFIEEASVDPVIGFCEPESIVAFAFCSYKMKMK
jgi:hypothetical protein